MRRITFFLIITLFTSVNCWAQKKTPEEKSIVNKEYDENGNLIQYDSTYVRQWNSDSTFNFSFADSLFSGREFPDFFGELHNDSIFKHFGFQNEPFFNPFGDDNPFRHFDFGFPGFPFELDSTFSFGDGNRHPFNFNLKEFEDLQKKLLQQFSHHNFVIPEFKSPEQKEEWEKLIEKQQKEKEELLKKWGNPQLKQY